MDEKLNHFDNAGNAIMVDVSEKNITERIAIATGKIIVSPEIFQTIKNGTSKKGDVIGVARIAGIMAAKKTSEMIPLCHPLPITHCKIDFQMIESESAVEVSATVKVDGKTGVEMEALHAVSIALLTIYDMCKAIDKKMELQDIHLLEKHGGKSDLDFRRN
ncbi:MAG: cyclic pyranopterin monophosphate synthase MoaC [Selenomonadaceae bacterium]|nr:cyclic pyranopterin monophosphate synthase MoaC [Selenomonadaceae bacterium]